MECESSDRQAARNAFSVVGRKARISYTACRAGRRWFCVGSETHNVHRRRRTVFLGVSKEGVLSIGFVICGGREPVIVWFKARVS
jgi:hypothetical protein